MLLFIYFKSMSIYFIFGSVVYVKFDKYEYPFESVEITDNIFYWDVWVLVEFWMLKFYSLLRVSTGFDKDKVSWSLIVGRGIIKSGFIWSEFVGVSLLLFLPKTIS